MKHIDKYEGFKNMTGRAGRIALSFAIAAGCAAPAPAIAAEIAPASIVAQAAADIGTVEVGPVLAFAGDDTASIDVVVDGVRVTGGYTVAYYESNEEGEKLADLDGAFAEGGRYLAVLTGDGVALAGERNVPFQAVGPLSIQDNWMVAIDDMYAYDGSPISLSGSFMDESWTQYAFPFAYVQATFAGADGSQLDGAPTAIGSYLVTLEGDGAHVTGSAQYQVSVYEALDLGDCAAPAIEDVPYTGDMCFPSFTLLYPDGYASAGLEVDSRLYTAKYYSDGTYLGDYEYPVEVGEYDVVLEGAAEYGCSGACNATFKITDDKPMVGIQLFDGEQYGPAAEFEADGSNPALSWRVGEYGEDGEWAELDASYYTVDVVDASDNAVTDYSAPGEYRVRAVGRDGYVGTSYCFFTVTEKAAEEPEPAVPGNPAAPAVTATNAMHRLYNPNSGEHFYTANVAERNHLVAVGWRYEGVGWSAPVSGEDVYRLYNPNAGDHHYTQSAAERDMLVKVGWRYEGVGWKSGGVAPVYRQYNPNAVAGSHNYTTNKAENDMLVKVGWRAEGVGWYATR